MRCSAPVSHCRPRFFGANNAPQRMTHTWNNFLKFIKWARDSLLKGCCPMMGRAVCTPFGRVPAKRAEYAFWLFTRHGNCAKLESSCGGMWLIDSQTREGESQEGAMSVSHSTPQFASLLIVASSILSAGAVPAQLSQAMRPMTIMVPTSEPKRATLEWPGFLHTHNRDAQRGARTERCARWERRSTDSSCLITRLL